MNIRVVSSSTLRRSVLGALLLGAPCGMALAQNVTINWPSAQFKGSVEIRGYPDDSSCIQLYTPPSGYKLRVTSYLLDSFGASVSIPYQYICTGKPTCSAARSAYITAPAGSTLSVTLTSGFMVNSGETLSVCNYSGKGKITSWTLYGFLYTS